MGDNLAELLYMAWRSALLSSQPDLPSWGNVRDPDVRAAWEAASYPQGVKSVTPFLYEEGDEMLGKATIDTKTHGQTKGKSGSYSTNFQMSGRELLTPDEVRKLDNRYALLFIRGASPVMDEKYDLMHHPAISHRSLGGAAPYIHHGTKPPVYTGRPLLRVGGTENSNPLKGEFH